MKKHLIFLFLFVCFHSLNAQQKTEVTYRGTIIPPGYSLENLPKRMKWNPLYYHSIISKDTTYDFITVRKNNKRKYLKNGFYGTEPLHHSSYFVASDKSLFEVVNFRQKLIIKSEKSDPLLSWTGDNKTILGYDCKAALLINTKGDTSIAWIAGDVMPDVRSYYFGYVIPGIVMEFLNLKLGYYFKAIALGKTSNRIDFPTDLSIVSLEVFMENKRNRESSETDLRK